MRAASVIVAGAIAAAALAVGAQPRTVTLYLPAFEGPNALGINVATVFNLQIWQTFRKAPTPNPRALDFGDGLVTWDDRPLTQQSHAGAASAMAAIHADLALWGKVWNYNDGVIAQTYLTIAEVRDRRLWQITAAGGPIGVDLPRLRYEFRTVSLSSAVVRTYSTPGALKLYRSATSNDVLGQATGEVHGLRQEAGAALVKSGGVTGWVRLPLLSSNRSEVADFVGGVIRILRADDDGASDLFQRVLKTPNVSNVVKIDAHLLRGLALERSGASGLNELRAAYEISQYDKSTVSYLLLGYLAAIGRATAGSAARASLVVDAQKVAADSRFLYPANDSWFARIAAALK